MIPRENKIKFLQVIPELNVGGAERVVLELTKGLERRGEKVGVAHLLDETKLMAQYSELSIPFFNLNISKKNPISFIKAVFQLSKIVKNHHIQLIHAHMFHALLMCILVKLLNKDVRLIFTSHSFAGFGKLRSILIRSTRKLRAADIVFSKQQHLNLNSERTLVIGNGVQTENTKINFSENREIKRFIIVGRLSALKDHQLLIKSFAKLSDQSTELWIVGDGDLRSMLENLVQEYNLVSRVKFWGLQQDVRHFLRKSDCFIISSKWEGLPMALLEAAMVGLPVISTPVGAVPELLENNRGYIATRENLAIVMEYVLNYPEEAYTRALNLQQWVESHYSAQAMVDKHINLYRSLVE